MKVVPRVRTGMRAKMRIEPRRPGMVREWAAGPLWESTWIGLGALAMSVLLVVVMPWLPAEMLATGWELVQVAREVLGR